jgi:excisionase family DNA binding protein
MSKTTIARTSAQGTNLVGEFITCKECASLLKLSEISIRRLLTQKKLKRFKIGARTLVRREEALSLIHESQ